MPLCETRQVNDREAGSHNLANFIAATAGRRGTTHDLAGGGRGIAGPIAGGLAIAGPIAVANGYITAAVPTASLANPEEFLDDAAEFFGRMNRS